MARRDIPTWTMLGILMGMVSSALVNVNLDYIVIIGAFAGGIVGYMLAKALR